MPTFSPPGTSQSSPLLAPDLAGSSSTPLSAATLTLPVSATTPVTPGVQAIDQSLAWTPDPSKAPASPPTDLGPAQIEPCPGPPTGGPSVAEDAPFSELSSVPECTTSLTPPAAAVTPVPVGVKHIDQMTVQSPDQELPQIGTRPITPPVSPTAPVTLTARCWLLAAGLEHIDQHIDAPRGQAPGDNGRPYSST